MALWRVISAAAIFGSLVDAIPTITFPFNSQVPPVARVSEPFLYTFSTSTFFSQLPLTYSLTDAPSWLSLNNDTRTLEGTPTSDTLGTAELLGVSFSLTASDASGSTTLNATLVVSRNPAPNITIPLSTQLSSFGIFSQPSTLLYHPSIPFKISFDSETFSFSGRNYSKFYYAITVDNTPLPAWITFDENTLSFSGQTPDYYSLVEPPQTFGIQLVASDVEGFSGTSIDFDIEVGVHLFAFDNQTILISATDGDTVDFGGLSGSLQLDGQSASIADISSITAQVPSWMTFDNTTLALNGIVPAGAASVNITIQAKDIYEDTATAFVYVNVSGSTNFTSHIFNRLIGELNATIGFSFSYDLGRYLNNRSDTIMVAHFSSPASWLSFDPQSFVFAGQVPSNVQPSVSLVTLNVTSKTQHVTDSQSFVLSIAQRLPSPSPETPTTIPTAPASIADSHHHLSTNAILAISIPTGLLVMALLLAVICCCHRRHAARRIKDSPSKSDISSPTGGRQSMAQIIRPGRLNPPEPLRLDTSGFASQTTVDPEHARTDRVSKKFSTNLELRRSQSLMAVSENPLSPLQESESSGNRARAVSDNRLSRSDPSWRSTQGSAYPTLRSSGTSSARTQRLSRNYSNYSRKGHTRRSAMVFSGNPPRPVMESVVYSKTREESILGLQDIDFSSTPLDDFSMLARHTAVQDTPQTYARKTTASQRSSRRRSKFMSSSGRPLSGLGHGARPSNSSIPGLNERRRSVGHGQDEVDGQGLPRDSRTWLTVGTTDMSERNRRSNTSALSEYSDSRQDDANVDPRIRAVTKSPAEPVSTTTSRRPRPLSRRVGSSPFFAGSSSRNSRRSPKKSRTSYADSPTVPEEATMANNLPRLVHPVIDELPRDSFGISYGLAREGTRQLRSYIQSQLAGAKSRRSLRSTESRDSRFESAAGSMLSLPQSRTQHSPERPTGDDSYEDFLRDGFSEESWETQGSLHNSQENVVLFDAEDSANMISEAMQARTDIESALRPGTSASNPVSQRPGSSSGIRFMMGAARRPLSVDASANNRTSRATRAVVDRGNLMDYTAYI
ncbi:uncharacterized protein LY89DRAFT_89743 [Mollisia scopiformis]|uniref:Dystroglycan-type cadherin-like domain-containing protein n=1 Tax=Mollisia scopiformis TaxID=149040 RepID=A0A194X614_MOLSC|nr:uncharacterized protein LY89DRAFT_89743 [Mollisia scopiformis]KUJ15626.1 hypothetical protein LY89DRAFT_89743 [Mollisia scopiformis]